MKKYIIKTLNFIMAFIYFFIKFFPTQNKITFISRQSNKNSLDFHLIQTELKKLDRKVKIVVLNKRFRDIDPLLAKIKYSFHIIVQMYHIATSKVVVLENYCIPISMLKHKKKLKVIQMWHALGSFKKFGYSIVNKEEGYILAKVAKMHKNYDYILTSSKATLKNFSEAFGYPEENFKILPLPRIDYLMNKKIQKELTMTLQKEYPILKKKKNIVYAPTFRKNGEDINKIIDLINIVDYEKYNLILKLHPLSKISIKDKRPILDKNHPTIDWINIADIIITDYSAIVYEASLLKKKIIFYAYDLDKYSTGRDFYIDYKKEVPGVIATTQEELKKALKTNKTINNKTTEFAKKYVDYNGQNCTKTLAKFILQIKEQ